METSSGTELKSPLLPPPLKPEKPRRQKSLRKVLSDREKLRVMAASSVWATPVKPAVGYHTYRYMCMGIVCIPILCVLGGSVIHARSPISLGGILIIYLNCFPLLAISTISMVFISLTPASEENRNDSYANIRTETIAHVDDNTDNYGKRDQQGVDIENRIPDTDKELEIKTDDSKRASWAKAASKFSTLLGRTMSIGNTDEEMRLATTRAQKAEDWASRKRTEVQMNTEHLSLFEQCALWLTFGIWEVIMILLAVFSEDSEQWIVFGISSCIALINIPLFHLCLRLVKDIKCSIIFNLTTHDNTRRFQRDLARRHMQVAVFQLFLFGLIFWPSEDYFTANGALTNASKTGIIVLYENYVNPRWWQCFWISLTISILPIGEMLLRGTGMMAALQMARFKIITYIRFTVLLICACQAIQFSDIFTPLTSANAFPRHHAFTPNMLIRFEYEISEAKTSLTASPFRIILIIVVVVCFLVLLFQVVRAQHLAAQYRGKGTWDFFLSHHQKHAGDQCAVLRETLCQRGWRVWYDNAMENINTDSMIEGVQEASVFILFLTRDVFTRPFVRLEIQTALDAQKHIILLHESKVGHEGVFDFSNVNVEGVEPAFKREIDRILFDHESIAWERRSYKKEAVVQEIIKQFYKTRKTTT